MHGYPNTQPLLIRAATSNTMRRLAYHDFCARTTLQVPSQDMAFLRGLKDFGLWRISTRIDFLVYCLDVYARWPSSGKKTICIPSYLSVPGSPNKDHTQEVSRGPSLLNINLALR